MASSKSWACPLVALLVAQLLVAGFAIEPEEFPLNGGVTNGVNVQFKVSSLETAFTLKFQSADRKTNYGWTVNAANQKILRSYNSNPQLSEQWGGWPFKHSGEAVFDFLFTKQRWFVSINGVRMPWFDMYHRLDSETIVYAKVLTGADDVLVTSTRPKCTKECHPSECKSTSGNNSCPEGSMCYSRTAPDDNAYGECSNAITTNMHPDRQCCEGTLLPVDMSTKTELWVQVHADQEYVSSVCDAFGKDKAKCARLNGTKVRIVATDSAKNTLQVWVPMFVAENGQDSDKSPYADLPPYILSVQPLMKRWFNFTDDEMLNKITVTNPEGLVKKTDLEAEGLEKYWFINMMTSKRQGQSRWFAFIYDRWDWESRNGDIHLVLAADEETPTTACVDDDYWTDKEGDNCTRYNEGEWCTEHGKETLAFRQAHWGTYGTEPNLYDLANATSWAAPWTCCSCGGGYHEDPDDPTMEAKVENKVSDKLLLE